MNYSSRHQAYSTQIAVMTLLPRQRFVAKPHILIVFIVLTCGGVWPVHEWTAYGQDSAVNLTQSTPHPAAVGPARGTTRTGGSDWPGFLGPSQDGKSNETGLIVPWPAGGLREVWRQPVGPSYGAGCVSAGRYFQLDQVGAKSRLRCLHSETGELIWDFTYPSDYSDYYGYHDGPRCSPVVDEDRVYIFGVEGMLQCLDVKDGRLQWKLDTRARFGVVQNFFGVGSTPVIYDKLLLVMVGGSPADDQQVAPGQLGQVRGNSSAIVALNKRTGEVQYRLSDELSSYASLRILRQPARDWCFAFLRGGLLGFDPATGREDFHFPWRARMLESVNAATPVVWDDRVFISETYGPGSALLRFRPGSYEVLWTDAEKGRNKSMQTHWNTPIYHEGYLYGSSGRHASQAELRCIEAATGQVQWSEPGLTRSSLLYVDRHLICLSEDGVLRLLAANPRRYELISEFRPEIRDELTGTTRPLLKPPAWAAPFLARGLLYVRGDDQIACFEAIAP
jgi:outer membrane protein assembly factor BamB